MHARTDTGCVHAASSTRHPLPPLLLPYCAVYRTPALGQELRANATRKRVLCQAVMTFLNCNACVARALAALAQLRQCTHSALPSVPECRTNNA